MKQPEHFPALLQNAETKDLKETSALALKQYLQNDSRVQAQSSSGVGQKDSFFGLSLLSAHEQPELA